MTDREIKLKKLTRKYFDELEIHKEINPYVFLEKAYEDGKEAQKAELLEKAREYQEKIHGGGNGRRIMEQFINLISNQ